MGNHILFQKEERENNTFGAEGTQDDEWRPSNHGKGTSEDLERWKMLGTMTSFPLSQVPSPGVPGLPCMAPRIRSRIVDAEGQGKKNQWSSLIGALVGYTGVPATI